MASLRVRLVSEFPHAESFDAQIAISSLPRAFGASLERPLPRAPYLCAEPALCAKWAERIGAALLLSLLDETVKGIVQVEAHRSRGATSGSTVVLPSAADGSSKLAEQVLSSTVNLAPLIERDAGDIVGIYVARDLDFSAVYALQVQP